MAPLDLSVVHWQTDEIFRCLFEDDEHPVLFRSGHAYSDVETDGPDESSGRFCLCLNCLFVFTPQQPSLFGGVIFPSSDQLKPSCSVSIQADGDLVADECFTAAALNTYVLV